ncbi:MAG TPA: triple tyrosine motif-containing protein [Chitinophagaceae bacterium]|jgi:signal transduction histidine kinase/streptogramin lyase|nr:triple tyrosine motif-containing protein [Chitinophagaceae bacterium]
MRQRLLLFAYIFVLIAIWSVASFAQQYPFVHYTPKDGLVSSRVKKCYQDSKGRMYFLTYGGLSVYDGARFRNYTTQNGLANNVINDILEVGDDSLLIACNASTLIALVKGKLVTVKTKGISAPLINQFYRHDDGSIYLSSDDGLFLLKKDTINALNISRIKEEQSEAPYLGNIAGVGNFLIITTNEMKFNKGIYVYDIKEDRICNALNIEGFLIGKDKKNNIWFSNAEQLFIVDRKALQKGKLLLNDPAEEYRQLKYYSTVNIAFANDVIWVVFRNKDFRNSEIRRIDEKGTIFSMPLPGQATISYLKNIFIDRENTIWLSNDGEGVFKIIHSPLQIFEKLFGSSTESSISNAFYSNGTTWYSTLTNKVLRKSKAGFEEYTINLKTTFFIFHETGNKIFAADGQNIYEGLIQGKKKIIEFQKIISLPSNDFFKKRIVVSRNGEIISCQNKGVNVWLNNKIAYHLPLEKNESAEDLFFDKNGRLWLVKRSNGISIFDLHPENPSQYLQPVFQFGKEQILGSLRSFVVDKRGIIWIGTRDDGIAGYEQQNYQLKRLYHFYSGNGLTDNFVTALACDSSNNVIVGTQTGLDRIVFDSSKSYRVENLSKSSNFFGYINQAWCDAKQAYALTPSGVLLQVSPSIETKRNNTPELLMEEIKVNAQTVSQRIRFSHKENNISFLVAAPSFIDEKQVSYSYLLEGSGNKQWSDTSSANAIINLTNLSAGNYKLNVKAFFPSSTYKPAELSYSFEITPPWRATWWFRTIAGLIFIGLLILGFRFYYKRRLEKQMAALEKQKAIEQERTRIATDMHDDLGAGLSRIKFLSQSILNKKGDDKMIATELGKITSYSDEMSEKMGEIIWALNEKNDTLADLIAYTRSYTMEYLANHNIECEADTPLQLPANFITGEMRRNIFLSVKECLHNIVKHAQASKVFFSVQLNGIMQIIIHDNGKGIDWNNQRAFSNGIDNLNKRMNEINGSVSFSYDQGTRVLLKVPLTL